MAVQKVASAADLMAVKSVVWLEHNSVELTVYYWAEYLAFDWAEMWAVWTARKRAGD